jgi:replication factor A1
MPRIFWRGRGRMAGRRRGASKRRKILEYLAVLAVKYDIDADEFLNCIVEAWNQEESKCEQVNVRCRERTRDRAIFLFTAGNEVLAQFPIPTQILQGKNELEDYMKEVSTRAPSAKKVMNPEIRDLKAGMKKVSLRVRVLEIPEPNRVYTRQGTMATVTNALVGDETGTIRMNLWNRQINMVSQGDLIKIENGTVARFRGERQLRIGKHGKITVVQDAESLAR